MAKGINPLTKTEVAESDVVNNVKISRCLFYVSDILGKVISNGGVTNGGKAKKTEFNLGGIDISAIEISETPVTVSVIAERINSVKPENMKKLKVTAVTNWLVSLNMLSVVTIS